MSIFALLWGLLWYPNWAAEKNAKNFCSRIEPGSDISLAIVKFEREISKSSALHYGSSKQKEHVFIFKGFMFDKAYCIVVEDANNKVVAKNSFMQYD